MPRALVDGDVGIILERRSRHVGSCPCKAWHTVLLTRYGDASARTLAGHCSLRRVTSTLSAKHEVDTPSRPATFTNPDG